MQRYDHTSAPWAWRLDPHSGSSSSLGPTVSTTHLASDPLTPLSRSSASSSADSIFWQDFRPTGQQPFIRMSKSTKLHRFDSDDEEQGSPLKACKEEAVAIGGWQEEDASTMSPTSSQEGQSDVDQKRIQAQGDAQTHEASSGSVSSSFSPSATRRRQNERPGQSCADERASNTRLVAHAIHQHALGSTDHSSPTPDHALPPPPPLTYKETLRLVRLIAMLFRFPKPTRRISRQRRPPFSAPLPAPPPTIPPEAADTIQLKPKYLSPSVTSNSSRKARMLARVHHEDARLDSDAVLKLIALLPAALPARVAYAQWVVRIAVKAKRDHYGNILLPDAAYIPDSQGLAQSEQGEASHAEQQVTVKHETQMQGQAQGQGQGGWEEEQMKIKVTRAMRHKLGKQAPSIPLPGFWRRRAAGQAGDTCAAEAEAEAQAQADIPTLTSAPTLDIMPTYKYEGEERAPSTEISFAVSEQAAGSNSPPSRSTSTDREMKTANLSKLIAERMRSKREAKTLLLRTHPLLRKPKSHDTTACISSNIAIETAESSQEREVDAQTAANTVANSRAQPS